ncbi:MAG TPA: CHAT domain-containing protein [Acidobacteriota bacterium]|nr:CHAT domain-containing protein [Acidobacteriota bacterium]HNG93448.1 CHAT domain-containing protein [Acidobacteriota bacterium]
MLAHLKTIIALSIINWALLSGLGFSSSSSALSLVFQAPNPEPRTLNPAEKHTYPLTLKADDFLNLVVEQQGIDVVVRLVGPDGTVLIQVDSPNGTEGPEPLSFIAELAGDYRLEVESLAKTGSPGKYQITLDPFRPATDQNRSRLEIKTLLAKIEALSLAGNDTAALPLAIQALEKSEKTFGENEILTADSLQQLARIYHNQGAYAQAEPLYLRSLAIREKMLGTDHLDVANSLNNLAGLAYLQGDYTRAEALFVRSLTIREKRLGSNHPTLAVGLNNLASVYKARGDYARAEPMYVRSLAILEKIFGPDHLEMTQGLNNLALVYELKGEYTKAEPLHLKSLAIREKSLGAQHPGVAISLNNLAEYYRVLGDTTKAESLFQRALTIWETALGPDHPNVAFGLNNLANLYEIKGEYAQAERLHLKALAIREKTLGSNHPDVAQSYNNLAGLLQNRGDFAQAESLYVKALAIREKTLGATHPETAQGLNNLANLYETKGEIARAEPLYLRAFTIWKSTLGDTHPTTARCLNNLARLYQIKGDTAQAIQFLTACTEATERDLMRNLVAGSENQKARYLKQTADRTDQTISLHIQVAPNNREAMQAALTVILRRKGRSLDALASAIAVLKTRQDAQTQKLLDDYASLASQISALTLRGPGQRPPEAHLAEIQALETHKDQIESEISRRSAEFQAQTTPITLEAIRKLIPADATLVEYAVYRPFNPKTTQYGGFRYVVYVLDQTGTIRFADLGEAAPIDTAVAAFRSMVRSTTIPFSRETSSAAQELDRLVMQPVRNLIGPARHLLISPDGTLHLIPFSALVDQNGKFLVETYTLTYLTSGRDLLRLKVKLPAQESAVIIANPNYGNGAGPILAGHPLDPLPPLPETAREGKRIQSLLKRADFVSGRQATEHFVKSIRRPEVLHIATHGYFLADTRQEIAGEATRDLKLQTVGDLETWRIENPLLRSWLFFSGANQGGQADNDGTMTALEAAQLDLWGTKLVVLSACETGVGETKNGDGVFGLRRALVLAGSESQMISLWAVSDRATRELMVDYYTRLRTGEGRSQALRNVQLKMLKNPKYQHPFYWAAFIQSGEWARLDGVRK